MQTSLFVVKGSLSSLIAHITRMPEMHFPWNLGSVSTDLCSPIFIKTKTQATPPVWPGMMMAFESQASYANNSNEIETVLRVQNPPFSSS